MKRKRSERAQEIKAEDDILLISAGMRYIGQPLPDLLVFTEKKMWITLLFDS